MRILADQPDEWVFQAYNRLPQQLEQVPYGELAAVYARRTLKALRGLLRGSRRLVG